VAYALLLAGALAFALTACGATGSASQAPAAGVGAGEAAEAGGDDEMSGQPARGGGDDEMSGQPAGGGDAAAPAPSQEAPAPVAEASAYGPTLYPSVTLAPDDDDDPTTPNDLSPDDYHQLYYVTPREGVNLRAGPGTGYGIVTAIRFGEPVNEYGRNTGNTDWAYVHYKDYKGWVNLENLVPYYCSH
jgi:hypothetical protein